MSTALLQVRVNEDLKKRVDHRLKRMGLTTSAAVNLLLHQIDIQGRIPFPIVDQKDDGEIPAGQMAKDLEDVRANRNMSRTFSDTKDLFEDLGI